MRRRSSMQREGRLAARASAGFLDAAFEAAGAALGAQSVIAQRTAMLGAAVMGLRPADHPEFSRMGVEKLEAALAAGPALVSYWAGVQMQLAQLWYREMRVAARILGSTAAPGPQAMARLLDGAAARSRAASLGMLAANTAAMTPVLTPYYGRIRRNARRLAKSGGADTSAPGTGAPRRARSRRS